MTKEGASQGPDQRRIGGVGEGAPEGGLSKAALSVVDRAERICGVRYETRREAQAALDARVAKKREAMMKDCRDRRGTSCDQPCKRSCIKDERYAARRRDWKAAAASAISAARAKAPVMDAAPAAAKPSEGKRIGGAKVKGKARPKKTKLAADQGLRKVVVEERRMTDQGIAVVDRSEASARTVSIFRLTKQFRLTSFQEQAAKQFAKDWELAASSLRSPGFEPRVDGGMASTKHIGALEAQRRIEGAHRFMGDEDFLIAVGAVIHGFSATRIHAAGGPQHVVASELVRRSIRSLAGFYSPGIARPDRTIQAIAKLIHEAQEGREDGAADILKGILAKAKSAAPEGA